MWCFRCLLYFFSFGFVLLYCVWQVSYLLCSVCEVGGKFQIPTPALTFGQPHLGLMVQQLLAWYFNPPPTDGTVTQVASHSLAGIYSHSNVRSRPEKQINTFLIGFTIIIANRQTLNAQYHENQKICVHKGFHFLLSEVYSMIPFYVVANSFFFIKLNIFSSFFY